MRRPAFGSAAAAAAAAAAAVERMRQGGKTLAVVRQLAWRRHQKGASAVWALVQPPAAVAAAAAAGWSGMQKNFAGGKTTSDVGVGPAVAVAVAVAGSAPCAAGKLGGTMWVAARPLRQHCSRTARGLLRQATGSTQSLPRRRCRLQLQ